MHPLQANALEIRKRMFNPPNGRVSSDLDVVPEAEFRKRQRLREQAKQIEEIHRANLDAAKRAEIEEMIRKAVAERARVLEIARRMADEQTDKPPSMTAIIRAVCSYFNVTPLDVYSERRTANVVMPRQIVMYLGRKLTPNSYPVIGMRVGRRDHTTAMHAYKKIAAMIEADPEFAAEIAQIESRI